MPRLTPEMEHCTFFACNAAGDPGGTGFIVGRHSPAGHPHYYAITNKHVYVTSPCVRVNTRGGKARLIDRSADLDWHFIKDGPDVVASDITDELNDDDLITTWGEGSFVTPDKIATFNIGIGDEGVMIGMFYDHHGDKSGNAPVGRFGSVAHIANEKFKVKLENDQRAQAYHLMDMRSRSGFSGSPVFVYRTIETDLNAFDQDANEFRFDAGADCFLLLLGIHCGQFKDQVDAKKFRAAKRKAENIGDLIVKEGDVLEIPSSMTCVLPAWHITKALDHPKLVSRRIERDTALGAEAPQPPRPEGVAT